MTSFNPPRSILSGQPVGYNAGWSGGANPTGAPASTVEMTETGAVVTGESGVISWYGCLYNPLVVNQGISLTPEHWGNNPPTLVFDSFTCSGDQGCYEAVTGTGNQNFAIGNPISSGSGMCPPLIAQVGCNGWTTGMPAQDSGKLRFTQNVHITYPYPKHVSASIVGISTPSDIKVKVFTVDITQTPFMIQTSNPYPITLEYDASKYAIDSITMDGDSVSLPGGLSMSIEDHAIVVTVREISKKITFVTSGGSLSDVTISTTPTLGSNNTFGAEASMTFNIAISNSNLKIASVSFDSESETVSDTLCNFTKTVAFVDHTVTIVLASANRVVTFVADGGNLSDLAISVIPALGTGNTFGSAGTKTFNINLVNSNLKILSVTFDAEQKTSFSNMSSFIEDVTFANHTITIALGSASQGSGGGSSGVTETFTNTSANTYYVYEFDWYVDGVLVPPNKGNPGVAPDGAPAALVYTFTTSGDHTIKLVAKGRWTSSDTRNDALSFEKTFTITVPGGSQG